MTDDDDDDDEEEEEEDEDDDDDDDDYDDYDDDDDDDDEGGHGGSRFLDRLFSCKTATSAGRWNNSQVCGPKNTVPSGTESQQWNIQDKWMFSQKKIVYK